MKTKTSNTEGLSTIPDTRIVDGKLHFEKKWYEQFSVYTFFLDIYVIFFLGIIEDNLFLLKGSKSQNFLLLYLLLVVKL